MAIDGWNGSNGFTAEIEAKIALFPGPMSRVGSELLRRRVEDYGEHPWAIGDIRVVDDKKGGFTVRVEARAQTH